MSNTRTLHLNVNEATTALALLQKELELSVTQIKQLGTVGCVWWQGDGQKPVRIRRLKKPLTAGEQLHCYYDAAVINETIVPASCIADETDFSIWLKPRGMFSQGTKWGDANSISRYVEQALSRPTWLVHRLDRMTAGLMILSHKKALVAQFSDAFERDDVQKVYVAIVSGKQTELPLRIISPLDGKASHTEVFASYYSQELKQSLVCVRIHSGRKHQIRRHLAEAGTAVVGDRLYGHKETAVDLQLVAQDLRFSNPVSGEGCQYSLDEGQLKSLLHPDYHELVAEMFREEGLQ